MRSTPCQGPCCAGRSGGSSDRGKEHRQTRTGTDQGRVDPESWRYRKLKTFQLAEVIYDVTVRFCEKYVDPRSRTVDQMTQAARSGRQNIAEGSVDSATSKKMELKLTGVAKGSLEELRLDYEDYLRQRGLPKWEPNHPALVRFKGRRCGTFAEFRAWVADEVKPEREDTEKYEPRQKTESGAGRHDVRESPCPSVFVANGALSLIDLCLYLLDRQLKSQAEAFEKDGGFTERLYRKRVQARGQRKDWRWHADERETLTAMASGWPPSNRCVLL
jgi:four helix bundle suffix protein